ncbi:hypothetical protein Emed_004528 [Eimeria media]
MALVGRTPYVTENAEDARATQSPMMFERSAEISRKSGEASRKARTYKTAVANPSGFELSSDVPPHASAKELLRKGEASALLLEEAEKQQRLSMPGLKLGAALSSTESPFFSKFKNINLSIKQATIASSTVSLQHQQLQHLLLLLLVQNAGVLLEAESKGMKSSWKSFKKNFYKVRGVFLRDRRTQATQPAIKNANSSSCSNKQKKPNLVRLGALQASLS